VYQTSTNPFVRAAADVQLVEGMHGLTYTDPGDAHYDPEAGPLRRNIAWGALA